MLLRMVKAGLLTGFLTAVFYTFIYSVLILPIIQKAEIIEKGHISSELRIKTSDQSDKKRNLVTPSLEKNDEKDSSTQILLNDHYQDTLLTKRFFFTFLANLILAVTSVRKMISLLFKSISPFLALRLYSLPLKSLEV